MMKRKLINIFICCIISICCNAQLVGYTFYAPLDTIKKAGFYNIILSPQINAHLKTDYSDVRIVNAAGKWVPHALHVPAFEINRDVANMNLEYSIKESSTTNTSIVINAKSLSLNNIQLSIKNTNAERYCSLSGSNDNANWFVINDSIIINPTPTETKTDNIFKLNFPLSNYKFYKLVIINSNKDPLLINGITSSKIAYDPTIIQNKITENPNTILLQKDSGNISYTKVTQQQPYHFDAISLKIGAVKYYIRKMDLFTPIDAKHSFSNPGRLVETFTISNNSNLRFNFPIINDSIFYILIHNEDNLPLKVNQVATTLNEHFIKAYLENENNYRLIMGNKNATLPNYDIEKLNLTLTDSAGILKPNKIISFPQQQINVSKKAVNNKWIIWTALIAGLFVLLFLTKKMIKEVDKKTTNDTL